MPFNIENDTHWRTDDIKKMLAACVAQGADTQKRRKVQVKHGDSHGRYGIDSSGESILIELPVEGPKNAPAMLQLAAAGYDVPVLLPTVTGFLMNTLAWEFYRRDVGNLGDPVVRAALAANTRNTTMPAWTPKGLVIRKYADPAKDSTFRKYAARVERDIKGAERRVAQYQADLYKAQRLLRNAQRDLKKHQARLATAKERRGL